MYLKLVSSCLFSLQHCRCPEAKDHIWLVPGWVSVPVMSQVPEATAERHRDRETQGDMERDRERWDRATERHTHAKSGREGEEQENWTHFCFFLLLSFLYFWFCFAPEVCVIHTGLSLSCLHLLSSGIIEMFSCCPITRNGQQFNVILS